jgi:transposase InsO family protein
MTDYVSKWTETKALKSKSASEVVDFVFDTISTFGCMETIITDQGREFVNSMNDKLCDLLDIKHKLTSPYHPQANGLDERFNQTLKRALEKLVNTRQNDWDVLLKHVLFAYRTSENASTKYTPFYLMFGKKSKDTS